jgi:hypothetical protein
MVREARMDLVPRAAMADSRHSGRFSSIERALRRLFPGNMEAVVLDANVVVVAREIRQAATPLAATMVDMAMKVPHSAAAVELAVKDPTGRSLGVLSRAVIRKQ